jgi:hypothetical protein
MSMPTERPGEPDQPIFTSVRQRRMRNSGAAILVLMLAALIAVLVVIVVNSLV